MDRRQFHSLLTRMLAAGALPSVASGAGHPRRHSWRSNDRSPQAPAATTSGEQLVWGDVRCFHHFRIQQHALTGQYRLVDGRRQQYAAGSLDACQAALDGLAEQLQLPPMQGTAVLLLHGLFRDRYSMIRMARYFAQQTDWQVLNLDYPSTRGSIATHAEHLGQIIAHLQQVQQVHLVAHSMGNLVIRRWLTNLRQQQKTPKDSAAGVSPELGRMVMLAPPNQRPSLAQALLPLDWRGVIAGAAGDDLNGHWQKLAAHLATPPCEFGILAGGLGNAHGYNPLIPGDDDMIVGVQETHLAGACDFRVLPFIHANIADVPVTHQLTHRFLQKGYFVSAAERQPLGG